MSSPASPSDRRESDAAIECESCGKPGATPTLCEGDEIADLCAECIAFWRSPVGTRRLTPEGGAEIVGESRCPSGDDVCDCGDADYPYPTRRISLGLSGGGEMHVSMPGKPNEPVDERTLEALRDLGEAALTRMKEER